MLRRLAMAAGIICAAAGAARAQAPTMPLEVVERMWLTPGPVQSGAGAPRMLVSFPGGSITHGGERLRYQGRVEPVDAQVTLNGEAVRIWPGGTFSGVSTVGGDDTSQWRFVAQAGGRRTTVERAIRRPTRSLSPPAWPLRFHETPVEPTGLYWVTEGATVPVTLYGSAGQTAEARVGMGGAWQPMVQAGEDGTRGGIYRAELTPPVTTPAEAPAVWFRLSGASGGASDAIEIESGLRLGARAERSQDWVVARVAMQLATYLKSDTGWERYGNLIAGTPMPVLEIRGERFLTTFDHGIDGWGEMDFVELTPAPGPWVRPALEADWTVAAERAVLALRDMRRPGSREPTAAIFGINDDGASFAPQQLRLTLVGAESAVGIGGGGNLGDFTIAAASDGMRGEVPAVDLTLGRPLWGFEQRVDAAAGEQVIVRVAPRLTAATAERPLAGLRIMLDAGHGGGDSGAVGPSGLMEKDANLVQAAWLERELAARGATVVQTRSDDVSVGLDDRVWLASGAEIDMFISLHHNSLGGGSDPLSDRGPITFYHYAHSRPLAEWIETSLVELAAPESAIRVKPENFRVNRNVSAVPSVLIETAYLPHPDDEARVRDIAWVRLSARAIAEGVARYMGSVQ